MVRGSEVLYIALTVVLLVAGIAAFLFQPGVTVVERTVKEELPPERIEKEPIVEKAAEEAAPAEEAKPAAPKVTIEFNRELAEQGAKFFKEMACVACHTVKSAGITVGGNTGPDLSLVLIGSPGVEPGTAGGPIMDKWFRAHGLDKPEQNLEKAAKLLADFLCTEPPSDIAPTMHVQIRAFRQSYGDEWCSKYVPALVELFKMALAQAQR